MPSLLTASLDQTLTLWVVAYGAWALALVALIVFAETGFVVAPFLPGDSLLFLTGAVVASASLNVHSAVLVLIVAAVLGDALNFMVGRHAAPYLLRRLRGRWLRQAHLDATQRYFERFGGATIVIARFVPVIRTLAPFLAGAGAMAYARFALFNVAGAFVWVATLVYAGAYLGSQPFVRQYLSGFTLGIVIVSVMPVALSALRSWRARRMAHAVRRTEPDGS